MSDNAAQKNRLQRYRTQLKKLKSQNDELMQALEQTAGELEETKKKPTPEALENRTKELEGKLRARSYKDAFGEAAKAAKVKPEHVDDLFDLAKLEMDADEPDGKKIKAALEGVLEKRQWAIASEEGDGEPDGNEGQEQEEGAPEPKVKKLAKDENGSRGGHGGKGGMFTVRRSDITNPQWMQKNQTAYAEAIASNNVHYIN